MVGIFYRRMCIRIVGWVFLMFIVSIFYLLKYFGRFNNINFCLLLVLSMFV